MEQQTEQQQQQVPSKSIESMTKQETKVRNPKRVEQEKRLAEHTQSKDETAVGPIATSRVGSRQRLENYQCYRFAFIVRWWYSPAGRIGVPSV